MQEEVGPVIRQLNAARRRHHAGLRDGVDLTTLLEEGDITGCELLPWGSNYTFVAAIRYAGEEWFAIYKPRRGEIPLWDFPQGTLYRRECAAYLLAQGFGWEIVPPTIIRRGPLGTGSFQLYVDCDPEENYFTFGPERVAEAQRVTVFDCIANNADRKAGHLLLGVDGRLWAIDHGLTFHAEPKLRTVIWDFAGERIPDVLLVDVARLARELASGATLSERLEHLLSKREVEALRARVDAMLRHSIFPLPTSRLSVPWPPV